MALRLYMRAAMTAASFTVLGAAGAAQAQTNVRDYQDCRWEQNVRVQYPFYVDQNGCLRGPAQSGDRAITGSIANGAVSNGNVTSPTLPGSGTSPVVSGGGTAPVMDRPTRGSGTSPVAAGNGANPIVGGPARGSGTSPVVDSGTGINDDVVAAPGDTKSNNGKARGKEAMTGNPGNDRMPARGRAGEKEEAGGFLVGTEGVRGRSGSGGSDKGSEAASDKDTGASK